ncbi:MAG TPA: xylulokinase [Candidatus Anoxymicrobiaceae bacterium]
MKKCGKGPFLVGLDLGTTGAKAGVIGTTGAVMATSFVSYETSTPRPGWAEQDPADWWDAATRSVRDAVESSGAEPGDIAGIGVSGQMHGSVFLDGSGTVVRPCILWCDQRTSSQCEQITRTIGLDRLSKWTGNPALPGFTAPKVLWLRKNEPDCYGRVRRLLLPKDYINLRLTGVESTEMSDASGTLLFDVGSRNWSGPMLDALEIPTGWLPPVFESGDRIGGLSPDAAKATGLPEGTPVAAGGADNACGALGMGVLEPGRIAVSLGSSGTVLAPTSTPVHDPEMRLHSFCHAVPGTWYLMGVMLSAGLALRWFRDELGELEVTEASRLGIDPYEILIDEASMAPVGCDGLTFLPYLSGERTPHTDPDARGVLYGLDLTKRRAHMVRAILEGVTFGLEDSLEIMRDMGVPLDEVVSGGGGSRSRFWRQVQADVFELPITAAGTSDSAMLGAGILAGVAAGVFDSVNDACSALSSNGERLEPDESTFGAYHKAYLRYRNLYPSLKMQFARDA